MMLHRATQSGVRFGRECRRTQQRATSTRQASPSDVFVLDFDGVLVDSEPEVTKAGLKAAQWLWPGAFEASPGEAELQQKLRQVRPAVIEGYETAVMARLLASGTQPEAILSRWPTLLHETLSQWSVTREDVKSFMEDTRKKWMVDNSADYLRMHQVYNGVDITLQMCEFPFYIASSKKAGRVSKLMTELVGIPMPEDSPRLFAGLLPPDEKKAEALRMIMERPICKDSGARLHFVDDRLETLKAIQRCTGLDRWNLWFADWGYNTLREKDEAASISGIRSISLKQFQELLKWGVVMGVDDGCEPDAHEIQAQISNDHGLANRS